MDLSRRTLLGALSAALLCPIPALAGQHNQAAQDVQRALLGFDLLQTALQIRQQIGLPRRWDRAFEELFAGVDTAGGVRRLQQLAQDPAFASRAAALLKRMQGNLGVKLWFRRLVRRAPERADALGPWIEQACGWLGLDLPALRAATADLPEGLLVVVGPPTSPAEIAWSLLREPFVRFLELVHGRQAREWIGGSRRALLEQLLDPQVRVVCFVGHGTWSEFSLSGFPGHPDAMYAKLIRRLRSDLRRFAPTLFSGNRWGLGLGYLSLGLHEDELAPMVQAWFPDAAARTAAAKQRVVRYTCGSARWAIEPALAVDLLPPSLREVLDLHGAALAPATPSTPPQDWQQPLTDWLDDRAVHLREQPAFGQCLVADPADTWGYDGISWLPDFVEQPLPGPARPWSPPPLPEGQQYPAPGDNPRMPQPPPAGFSPRPPRGG